MNKVLRGLIGKGVEVYPGDLLVHARMRGEHDTLMETIFIRLKRNSMKANKKKILLLQKEVKLLEVGVDG
jgi:hypothetical protein